MAAPKISATVVDVNTKTVALTGDDTRLIKFHSTAYAEIEIIESDGAIAEDYYIIDNIGGDRVIGESSHTFYNVESNVFNFSAEDEYGNIGYAYADWSTNTLVPYIKLTCNIINNKPDGEGNMRLSCYGSFFNDNFGAVDNSLTVRYSYTGSDGSKKNGNMSVSIYDNNAYSAYVNLSGLNYEASYTFEITATDKLEEVTSRESGVTSLPLFHWGKDDFTFEVPVNFNGSGTTRFKGDLRLKGEGNFDNTLYFGDGDFCYITGATDDSMTIQADNIALSATYGITINGESVEFGTWTPEFASSGAVDYYDVQEGWYQKLGSVVTIGWQLKAEIALGYDGTTLKIEGVPFTPSVNAFGGGVAFNIFSNADYFFEGWCVNTSGEITARLQSHEKDPNGNLRISSYCYYPVGGGTVTLAGTICYMTY